MKSILFPAAGVAFLFLAACTPETISAGSDTSTAASSASSTKASSTSASSSASATSELAQSLCAQTGGTESAGSCCTSAEDFPNSCAIGACGCSPANSHTVKTCSCPASQCFDPKLGCTVAGGAPTESLCVQTGGTESEGSCCTSAGDFPNSCLVGACGCSLANSHTVKTCSCPANQCFDSKLGCTDPGGTPTQSLCAQTGGIESIGSCCTGAGDFPDSCAIGACGCSLANSQPVKTCSCPTGTCYDKQLGCQ